MNKISKSIICICTILCLNTNAQAYDLLYPKMLKERPLEQSGLNFLEIKNKADNGDIEAMYEVALRYENDYQKATEGIANGEYLDVDIEPGMDILYFTKAYKKNMLNQLTFWG